MTGCRTPEVPSRSTNSDKVEEVATMNSVRIDVAPPVLEWARARSGIDPDTWARRFPHYSSWLDGEAKPTLKQLQSFAKATHTPIGYYFLETPPIESLPIADFRTVANRSSSGATSISANLLDTIYACQIRQEWFRENQLLNREPPVAFVGNASDDNVASAAAKLRTVLGWTPEARAETAGSVGAVAALRDRAEAAGVLVMISGVVGSNTHRSLDPDEFRGFAISDPYAPLVFVNGADAKAAQLFTLAHELAHIARGETGVSEANPSSNAQLVTERWCNGVAAELLVPLGELRAAITNESIESQIDGLARRFRVSRQVTAIRLRDAGRMTAGQLADILRIEISRTPVTPLGSGGNYYNSKPQQVSRRFARAVITSTLEGTTPYTRAFRMLDIKKETTFERLAEAVGVQ